MTIKEIQEQMPVFYDSKAFPYKLPTHSQASRGAGSQREAEARGYQEQGDPLLREAYFHQPTKYHVSHIRKVTKLVLAGGTC